MKPLGTGVLSEGSELIVLHTSSEKGASSSMRTMFGTSSSDMLTITSLSVLLPRRLL